MPKLATYRNAVVPMSVAPLLFLGSGAALLSACSPNQPPASTPGTTPSIWTGSPAPSATGSPGNMPGALPNITTHLKAPDGTQVATAMFEFNNGYATVTIETTGSGLLAPGFHGMHIHKVGKCEPNSVAPSGGAPGDFLSAGGHFQAPGHSAHPDSGYLPPLQVRQDGSAMLTTTTDAFTMDDLLTGQQTAIIIHAGADNFANIPTDRYSQTNGTPGPDQTTLNTGDAGKRVACGVIGSG